MFLFIRAATYSTIFIGLVLVFLPGQVLAWAGLARPASVGPVEIAGIVVALVGALLGLWCILTFAFLGKGTPAPFDPPRRLVVAGPYRYVRNPMYIGAGLALGGAAIFYRSFALLGYVLLLGATVNVFIVSYEEPALTRLFGGEYEAYRLRARRWLPGTRTP
jgi:protein-S-isoprenylcysteine O-methyltransferase Ste14